MRPRTSGARTRQLRIIGACLTEGRQCVAEGLLISDTSPTVWGSCVRTWEGNVVKRFLGLLAATSLVMTLASCGTTNGSPSGGGSVKLTAGQETTLSPAAGVTVTIEGDAVATDQTITYSAASHTDAPGTGTTIASFSLSPAVLTKAAKLTFQGTPGKYVAVYHYHDGAWTILPAVQNPDGTATAYTSVFSDFVVRTVNSPVICLSLASSCSETLPQWNNDKYSLHVFNEPDLFREAGANTGPATAGGECYGMTKTAAMYWKARIPAPVFYNAGSSYRFGTPQVIDFAGDPPIISSQAFATYVVHRQGDQVRIDNIKESLSFINRAYFQTKQTNGEMFLKLGDAYSYIAAGEPVMVILELKDGSATYHHAVLGYAMDVIRDKTQDTLTYRIHVYDPNSATTQSSFAFTVHDLSHLPADPSSWTVVADNEILSFLSSTITKLAVPTVFTNNVSEPLPHTNPNKTTVTKQVSGTGYRFTPSFSSPVADAKLAYSMWQIDDANQPSKPTPITVPVSTSNPAASLDTSTLSLPDGDYTGTVMVADQQSVYSAPAHFTFTLPASGGTAPTIDNFTANPTQITAGQSSTLSWSVTGTSPITLSIDNGVGTVTGSQHLR